jgi:hypothetical protein
MSRHILLICKRLLILTLVLWLSWFTLFQLFPFIDDRLPWGVAIAATYGFIAYIGLPALYRVYQALHAPNHVPTRSITGDGWAVDPINLAVVAKSEKDFIWAMQKAGWHLAEEKTFKTSMRMIYASLFNKQYLNAPFNPCYVFGRKQDLGFQIPIGNNPRHRHHVRFWRLGSTLLDDDHIHQSFWRKLLKRFIKDERQVWVGAAIMDRGINLRWRDLQINHSVDGNTMNERQFVVDSLLDAKVLKDSIDIKSGEPLHTRHQGFGETIIADGYVKLCEIKRQVLPPVAENTTQPTEQKKDAVDAA